MPILVKDPFWQDHGNMIYISVPLRNAHPSKVDIYSNSCYIKANYPPYFFELDLAHKVDAEASSCSIGNEEILFQLKKLEEDGKEAPTWASSAYTGEDRLERRQKAIEMALKLQEEIKEKKLLEKREKERELVRRQIQVEREAREAVTKLKEKEIQTAKDQIAAWTKDLDQKKELRQDSAIFTEATLEEISDEHVPQQEDPVKKSQIDLDDESSDDDLDLEAIRSNVKKLLKSPEHAPPRSKKTINVTVSFTTRGNIPTQTARETEDGIV
jgi:hypothetical protein